MSKLFKRHSRLFKENAQTMVEFALVFPILLLITYGLMEVGRMMLINAEVYTAAREGARYGATASNFKDCVGIREAASRLLFLVPRTDITTQILYDHGPSGTPVQLCASDNTYTGPANLTLLDRIVVSVDVFFRPMIGDFLGIDGFNIHTTNFRTILKDVSIEAP